jgi:hypothetical protein
LGAAASDVAPGGQNRSRNGTPLLSSFGFRRRGGERAHVDVWACRYGMFLPVSPGGRCRIRAVRLHAPGRIEDLRLDEVEAP